MGRAARESCIEEYGRLLRELGEGRSRTRQRPTAESREVARRQALTPLDRTQLRSTERPRAHSASGTSTRRESLDMRRGDALSARGREDRRTAESKTNFENRRGRRMDRSRDSIGPLDRDSADTRVSELSRRELVKRVRQAEQDRRVALPADAVALGSSGAISGTVTDSGTGLPLAGISVWIFASDYPWSPASTVVTAADGTYTSDDPLSAGSYFVMTYNELGYVDEVYDNLYVLGIEVTAGEPVQVIDGQTTSGINFALDVGGKISGTVSAAANGQPLSGIEIWIEDANGNWASDAATSDDGTYTSTDGLPSGTYYARTGQWWSPLLDELFDNLPCWDDCDLASGTPIEVTLGQVTTGVNFSLDAGGGFSGTVTDQLTGLPIEGVEIYFYDSEGAPASGWGAVQSDGTYVTEPGLPPGNYFAVTYNVAGYLEELYGGLPCLGDCDVTAGNPIAVSIGTITEGIDFTLEQGGRIAGVVTYSGTGSPAQEVDVEIFDSSGNLVTDAYVESDGSYVSSSGLAAGTYFVTADDWWWDLVPELYDDIPCIGSCDVTSGTGVSVVAGATTGGIDFALDHGGWLEGTVTDAATGLPLYDVQIVVYDSWGQEVSDGYSDADGTYQTGEPGGLPAGTYFARAFKWGYVSELFDSQQCWNCDPQDGTAITVAIGAATTAIDFALDKGGRIAGTVTDASNGSPIESVSINVYDADGWWMSAASSAGDGSYEISEGLPAGTYFVFAYAYWTGYLSELYDDIPWESVGNVTSGNGVAVSLGATTSGIDFALDKPSKITGTVTDANTGLPIQGVVVHLYESGGEYFGYESTDSAGAYEFTVGAGAGTYYAHTYNWDGYVNQLYDGIPCVWIGDCYDVTNGSAIVVPAGQTTSGVDFALELGGRVAGTVTDAVSGLPLAGFSVGVYDASGRFIWSAGTGSDGTYELDGYLGTGTYFVRTQNSSGYLNELYDGSPCWTGASGCDVTQGTGVAVTAGETTGDIDFALVAGGRISGAVTDAETGLPISGYRVEFWDVSGERVGSDYTDATGEYVSPAGLPTGTYKVLTDDLNDPGLGYIDELYADIPCPDCGYLEELAKGVGVPVTVGETTNGIDFALEPGGYLAGKITEDGTGDPIFNVGLAIYDAVGNYISLGWTYDYYSDGSYTSYDALPAGDYYVRTFNWEGYVNELFDDQPCLSCDVTAGTPVAVSVGNTTTGVDFELTPGGRIGGTVTESAGGLPIAGARVEVVDAFGLPVSWGESGADGSYLTQQGLLAGTYYAKASSEQGHVTELFSEIDCAACDPTSGEPIQVILGSTVGGVDFSLADGSQILGALVSTTTGEPALGQTVYVYDADGNLVSSATTSDSDGNFVTGAGLPSGTYYLSADAFGFKGTLNGGMSCPFNSCDPTQAIPVIITFPDDVEGVSMALAPAPMSSDGFDSEGFGAWSSGAGFGGVCAHSMCVAGPPLDFACDPCVAQVIAAEPSCGDLWWTAECVLKTYLVCGVPTCEWF